MSAARDSLEMCGTQSREVDDQEMGMDREFETNCPECGATVKIALADVAKQRTVRCQRGHNIALKDVGGGAREAQAALDDLDRALKRFGS
jgi:hypothetical protein